MRHVIFIARNEIGYQMRQRETLLWIFVMPIIFFYFIGTVTGGGIAGTPGGAPQALALVAPADAGFLVDQLARRLEDQNFRVSRVSTDDPPADIARRLVIGDVADGRTFTDAVLAGDPQVVRFESRAEGNAASFDQLRLQRAVYTLLADLAVAVDATGVPPTDTSVTDVADAPRMVTLEVTSAGRRVAAPSGFEQTIPGTMVMFTMLVLLTGGAIQLVLEREQGLLRRLASTPITRTQLVAGKWFGKLLLGLVQIGFAMMAGTVLFGMHWGTALPAVLAVLLTWAAFNASLGLLLGNLAHTPAQMAGVGVLTTMVLAALGGCWWPIEVTPAWAQQLALLLPTGWAMDAMHRLISFGDSAAAIVPHAAALSAATAVLGAAGVRSFRYQ